jgi:SAM-dependent methyltransferase
MSRLTNLFQMALGPLRERGLRETWRSVRLCSAARAREARDPFDATFGTDTDRAVTLATLDCDGPDVPALWRYWPTARDTFARILARVPLRFGQTVFIDLGSGKGRALLLAAEHPFRRIIGVELSPSLHRVATYNLAAWRARTGQRTPIELVCMDAADFMAPPEDALIYLFHPFPADTMRAVLFNLSASLALHPRRVMLAYLNPLHHALLVRDGFALEHWESGAARGEFDWALYRAIVTA